MTVRALISFALAVLIMPSQCAVASLPVSWRRASFTW